VICVLVNVGMWFERYNIIISSLAEDFLPSSWGHFEPGLWEIVITLGSFGLFFTFYLIFCKFFPIISLSEIKLIMPKPLSPKKGGGKHGH
jgi:molybdopterin-containing oxidoreductase family membrane subunit